MNNLTNKIIIALRLNSKEAKLSQDKKNDMFNKIIKDYDLESKNVNKKKKFHFPFKSLAIAFAVILVIVGIGLIPIFPNNSAPQNLSIQDSIANSAQQIQLIPSAKAGSAIEDIQNNYIEQLEFGKFMDQNMKITKIGDSYTKCDNEGSDNLMTRMGIYLHASEHPELIVKDIETRSYYNRDGSTYSMIGKDDEGNITYLMYQDNNSNYEYYGGSYIAQIVRTPDEIKTADEERQGYVDFYSNEEVKKKNLFGLAYDEIIQMAQDNFNDLPEIPKRDINVEPIQNGYVATEVNTDGCSKDVDTIFLSYYDSEGTIQSVEKYTGNVDEKNLIYRADFTQTFTPTNYENAISEFGPLQIADLGVEIRSFDTAKALVDMESSGNASNAALVKAVFEKDKLPALITTAPEYRVDQLYFASKISDQFTMPNQSYYSDKNFFASESDYKTFKKYMSEDYYDYGSDYIQADLMITNVRRDEDYNYHGFIIFIVTKGIDKSNLGKVMVEQATNPVKVGEIELNVDGKQVVFDKFEGTDNFTGTKKTYLSADIMNNYYVVISDLAEKETYEDVAKLKFELKDTTKPEDLKYMIDLGEEIY